MPSSKTLPGLVWREYEKLNRSGETIVVKTTPLLGVKDKTHD